MNWKKIAFWAFVAFNVGGLILDAKGLTEVYRFLIVDIIIGGAKGLYTFVKAIIDSAKSA